MRIAPTLRSLGGVPACVAAALAVSCIAAPPALQVTPTTALVDDPIGILASGLTPSSEFAIRATTVDQRQRPWVAEARFVAGQDGAADLSDIAPLPGSSYEGVDQMGLFWSATPSSEGAAIAHRPGVVYTTTLELVVDGQVLDKATIQRRFDAPDLTRLEVSEADVIGVYYRPSLDEPVPAVAVFAGSDGGIESAEWRDALLASRGFAALAVAMFGHPGRPENLVEIPLEDAVAAVSWLDRRPETGRIGALGFSKGTELGLALASEMAEMLVERMTLAGRADDVIHLRYPGAGHLLFWDFLPATTSERSRGQIFGGSPAATARARADSWPKIRAFLSAALAPRQTDSQKYRRELKRAIVVVDG